MFVGAPRARVTVDGVAAPGAPFDDDQWRPKLGRSLSSAHGAFAEVRVEPTSAVHRHGQRSCHWKRSGWTMTRTRGESATSESQ